MNLYHGTTERPNPTLENPHLTSSPDIAWYYAETAAEETGAEPVVYQVHDVDPQHLRYDGPAMLEPIALDGYDDDTRDAAWNAAAIAHPDWLRGDAIHVPDHAWEVSLQGAASVRYVGTISSDRIHAY